MLKKSGTILFAHEFTTTNRGCIDDFYSFDKRKIGEGSYGQVYIGTSDTASGCTKRAIKAIDQSKISDTTRFDNEIAIQQALDHPNIVKLYEVFMDAKQVYLVMELCTGGELFDLIVEEAEKHEGQAFDERRCTMYMRQILGAVQYLHAKHYVHRDIKPENFLMQSKSRVEIKVIDFGLAKEFVPGSPPMSTKAGTPYYVAPEVLAGSYDEKCDIWSCGVICYILICGYPPFSGDTDEEILRAVRKGDFEYPRPDWENISRGAKSTISKMLSKAATRPNAAQILAMEWIRTGAEKESGGNLPKDLGSRLKAFRRKGKLHRVTLTLIAKHMKDEEIKELRSTFSTLDRNKDGTLTYTEVRDAMRSHRVSVPPNLEEVIRGIDTDGSGVIDYTEFIAACMDKKKYAKQEIMWNAFRVFDKDGDGYITTQEIADVLKLGTLTLAEDMVQEVDLDDDRKISFEEFSKMLLVD